MVNESYIKITSYLTEVFGPNFILMTIVLTTSVSIGYFVVINYTITQMDKRHFITKKITDDNSNGRLRLSPIDISLTYVIKTAKIIAGICLFLCGVVMLVLPGQGVITMLIGLSLLPFPGKKKLEKNLIARKSVRNTLNWIRIKANREPFIFE